MDDLNKAADVYSVEPAGSDPKKPEAKSSPSDKAEEGSGEKSRNPLSTKQWYMSAGASRRSAVAPGDGAVGER